MRELMKRDEGGAKGVHKGKEMRHDVMMVGVPHRIVLATREKKLVLRSARSRDGANESALIIENGIWRRESLQEEGLTREALFLRRAAVAGVSCIGFEALDRVGQHCNSRQEVSQDLEIGNVLKVCDLSKARSIHVVVTVCGQEAGPGKRRDCGRDSSAAWQSWKMRQDPLKIGPAILACTLRFQERWLPIAMLARPRRFAVRRWLGACLACRNRHHFLEEAGAVLHLQSLAACRAWTSCAWLIPVDWAGAKVFQLLTRAWRGRGDQVCNLRRPGGCACAAKTAVVE